MGCAAALGHRTKRPAPSFASLFAPLALGPAREQIFVGNVSFGSTEEQVREFVKQAGGDV